MWSAACPLAVPSKKSKGSTFKHRPTRWVLTESQGAWRNRDPCICGKCLRFSIFKKCYKRKRKRLYMALRKIQACYFKELKLKTGCIQQVLLFQWWWTPYTWLLLWNITKDDAVSAPVQQTKETCLFFSPSTAINTFESWKATKPTFQAATRNSS